MIENTLNEIISWIKNNKNKFFGGLIGFLIAITILSIGFFRTFFIVFCTTMGYYIGEREFTREDIKNILEKLGTILPSNRGN